MITEATPQQKAAVIGFWRMGASEELIEMVTDIHYNYVVRIILDYEKKLINEENNCENRTVKKISTKTWRRYKPKNNGKAEIEFKDTFKPSRFVSGNGQ